MGTPYYRPQYVLTLTMALLTSYTVNARYAEPAFGRLTTRAIIVYVYIMYCYIVLKADLNSYDLSMVVPTGLTKIFKLYKRVVLKLS